MPFRPLTLTLGLGLTTAFAAHAIHIRSPLRCDSSFSSSSKLPSALRTYSDEAKVPVVSRSGRPNPAALKQVSAGSLLGLLCGVAISSFSKKLAMLFGLLVFGIQFAASKGYNILPAGRIQRYVKSIDLRSAVEDNVAFKFSFGMTCALAAFRGF